MAKGQKSGRVIASLTGLIVTIVSLFAFGEILDAVFPDMNTSSWFGSSTTVAPFVESIVPVFGVIAVFIQLYYLLGALKNK